MFPGNLDGFGGIRLEINTLQGTNICHLGKRKIIFESDFVRDMLVPRRVSCNTMARYIVHHIFGDPSMFTAELYQLSSPCDFCMIDGGKVHP